MNRKVTRQDQSNYLYLKPNKGLTMKKETDHGKNTKDVQLADKMIKILNDSEKVTVSVKTLQSKIEMKDRLHADFAQLKGKEKWLKIMIQKTEDSFGEISSGKDLEKYQKYISELPAVTKSLKLLKKRIDPALYSSIYTDIKDCKLNLESSIHIALSPTADKLQKKLDELTNSFLEEISIFASAFVRVKIKQDLVHRTNFPQKVISPLIPKIQDFERLAAYADDFYITAQVRPYNLTQKDA